ncbi:hypothetical protein A3K73_06470 [Candidatus Pacearchaeota archaeon RBG_13_36_9]|nr:MAG: hypothetical protein A3K73_06470 [Candidatus Pacearchaeota archaeon RBG_13_36_9]
MKEKKMVMEEEQNSKRSFRFIVVSLLVIAIMFSFLNLAVRIISYENPVEEKEDSYQNLEFSEYGLGNKEIDGFFSLNGSTRIKMYLPAVDAEGNGTNTILTVEVTPGSGRTLTDIDNLLFWADTQHSIRIARRVAENMTGKKVERYDIVYTIEAPNASLIGGPSAGAALAIATIAALEGRELNDKVMITGGINHDGTISPVSAILEKAQAAKKTGATLFLVPLLQSRDVVYEESEHCEVFGSSEICTTETRPKKVDVAKETGIEVVEVETVEDAMGYFFE